VSLAIHHIARPRAGRARAGAVSVALAATTFALGLALGLAIGPGIGRQVRANPAPDPATAAGPVAGPGSEVLAPPATERAKPLPGGYAAEVLRVLDGDTFEARVRAWPGIEITARVRLRGIDAPELGGARCAEERAKAEAARDALKAMLVAVMRVGLDKYGGRVLADAATRATPDISAAMLASGLARRYSGGRRESWCGTQQIGDR
jgi:endonuclease YncB( thermonuclease family)